MENPTIFQRPAFHQPAPRLRLGGMLRGLRLPLKKTGNLDAAAAETRAARLFAVNFRHHPWTR